MKELEKAKLEEVMETALVAGRILLENGAEIYRVEDTMRRIAMFYGVEEKDFFVLTNGIFTTGEEGKESFSRISYIPVKGADMSKVEAVNKITRAMVKENYSVETLREKLEEAKKISAYPQWVLFLGYVMAASSFAVLFGGGIQEALVSTGAGIMLFLFHFLTSKRLSKITGNILNGAVATATCLLLFHLGLGENLKAIIGGGVIILVPGVAFVNGIRDIGDGDYLSGTVRLLDAIVVFTSIAIGVGLVFSLYAFFSGVTLL